ncbi:MAG: MobA/MobL family protein [Chlorobium sp.]|nr:MobA/MobL family protein [Chlorobium sp.]
MALFHLHGEIIKRSKGKSAVQKAAYISRALLINENSGKRYDYRKKGGLLNEKIFIGKNPPQWLKELSQDPQALWSTVERTEKRKDAQLARHIVVALPHELTQRQRESLVKDYVDENFVKKGMVVHACFHAPSHPDGDTRNFHVHFLITMREIRPDGFGKKVREWNNRKIYNEWRMQWAQHVNLYLERYGHKDRVDHRSYKDQGIERDPTFHLGPTVTSLERKNIKTRLGDKRRKILKNNKEREYWSKRQAEHRRKMALENIKRDIRYQRDINDKDLRYLTPDDRNLIKTRGIDTLLHQFQKTRQRSLGRAR